MPAIQVRDVPPDLHARLRRRAAAQQLSLSTYVLRVLEREAGLPSVSEWLSSLRDRDSVRAVDVAAAVDRARADDAQRVMRVLRH